MWQHVQLFGRPALETHQHATGTLSIQPTIPLCTLVSWGCHQHGTFLILLATCAGHFDKNCHCSDCSSSSSSCLCLTSLCHLGGGGQRKQSTSVLRSQRSFGADMTGLVVLCTCVEGQTDWWILGVKRLIHPGGDLRERETISGIIIWVGR